MKLKKRVMSAAVACLMLVSLLPTTAFAAEVPAHTTHDYTILVSTLDPGNCGTGTKGIAKFQCSVEGCTKTTYKSVDASHTEPNDGVETVAPTCGTPGSKSYTCSTCGTSVEETIPATGEHVAEEGVIQATCTENAKVGTKCEVCGIQLGEAEEVPGTALGHDFKMTTIKEATCTEDGTQQMKCTRCDATQGAVQTIRAAGHKWMDVEDGYEEASCDHPARMKQVCDVCGETQYDIPTNEDGTPMLPALEHELTTESIPATCTQAAATVTTCKNCDYEVRQTTGTALGHDWETTETKEANCTEGGYTLQTCQRDDCDGGEDGNPATQKINVTAADANAHVVDTEKSTVLSEADCSKQQNAIYKAVCLYCGKSLGYKSVPYEHDYEGASQEVVTNPTCTTAGTATVTCQNTGCNHTETITVPATGHTWQDGADKDGWVVSKAPTCGETGLKSRDCQECDEDDETDVVIPATGEHEYEDKVIEATCQHARQAGSFCKVCDAANPDEEAVDFGDPVDHSFTVEVEEESVEATCTTAGKTVMKCEWCDETKETIIPATGHTEPEFSEITTKPGDCQHPTQLVFTCTVCQEEVTVDVDDGDFVAKPHTWATGDDTDANGWKVTEEATCTEEGSKTRTCSACGTKETEVIAKTAHTVTNKVVEATCAAGGYTVPFCSVCEQEVGDRTNETQPNANKHVYETEDGEEQDPTYLQEPSCTTAGVEIKICTNCGKRSYVTAPASHTYGDGEVTTPATCLADGVMTYTCEVCDENTEGHTKTEVISKDTASHNYVEDEEQSVEATCADGKTVSVCSVCGDKKEETVAGTGEHEYDEKYTAATCTENAKGGQVCSVCGEENPDDPLIDLGEMGDDFKATGHKWTKWVVVDEASCEAEGSEKLTCATCSEDAVAGQDGAPATVTRTIAKLDHEIPTGADGKPEFTPVEGDCEHATGLTFTCANCGETITEYVDDGGTTGSHTWATGDDTDANGWKVTTEATCTTAGSKTRTCSACNKVETETIPMTAHTLETKTVDANCRTEGYTILACSVCGQEQGDKLSTIPVNSSAHVYADDDKTIYLQEPTCTEAGVARKTCTECGKSSYVKVDASHDWDEGEETTAPSCTEPGEKTFTCSVCQETKTEAIAATGHDYATERDETKSVDPNCGEAGKDVFVCNNNCGVDKEVAVAATGEHQYDDDVIAATCTEPAKAGMVCTVCGAEDPENPVEEVPGSTPLGHNWGQWETEKEANCTEDGTEKRTCTREGCDAFETRTVKAAHTPGDPDYTPANCTEAGHVVTECTVCHEVLEDEDLTDVAPALGHKPVVNKQDPTCTADGWTETVCERCEEVLSEKTVIPANGEHSYEIKVIQESTCTVKGIGRPTCSVCGVYKSFVALDLAEHTWGEEYVEDNTKVYHKCTECGEVELVADLTDPDPDEPDPVDPSTCTHEWGAEYTNEDGTAVMHKCTICQTEEKVRDITPDPDEPDPDTCEHEWEWQNTGETDGDGNAVMKQVCTKCGAEKDDSTYTVKEPAADEPETEETEADEPETEETVADEPEAEETVADESETEETVADEPEAEETEAGEPEAEETEADEPETEETEADEPETEETVSDESEAEEPVADEPETEETVADEPEIEEPVADEPEVEEPVVNEPEIEEPVE